MRRLTLEEHREAMSSSKGGSQSCCAVYSFDDAPCGRPQVRYQMAMTSFAVLPDCAFVRLPRCEKTRENDIGCCLLKLLTRLHDSYNIVLLRCLPAPALCTADPRPKGCGRYCTRSVRSFRFRTGQPARAFLDEGDSQHLNYLNYRNSEGGAGSTASRPAPPAFCRVRTPA